MTAASLNDQLPTGARIRSPIARRRRNAELTLVVMAAMITAAAYAVAALGTNAEIPPGIVVFIGFLVGLLLCAHVVVRLVARFHGGDASAHDLADGSGVLIRVSIEATPSNAGDA